MPPQAEITAVGQPIQEPVQSGLRFRTGATALGLAAVALAVLAPPSDADPVGAAVRVAAVVLPVGFGLYRLAHDRRDRFALLLVAVGALWSVTTLAQSSESLPYSVGRTSAWLVEPALVFLILAFPHGRLETAVDRRLFASVAAVVALLYLPTALLTPFPEPSPWATCGTSCPADAFLVAPSAGDAVDGFIRPAREVLSVLLFAAVALTVTRRVQRAGPILKRILVPVAAVALVRVIGLAFYFPARGDGGTSAFADALGWMYILSLPMLTLSFAAGLLAHRLFVADALERLTQTLPARQSPRELRAALAGALRDPPLEVLFWVPSSSIGWVDGTGVPTAGPRAGPGRAVTEVSTGGRRLAAVIHDRELSQDRAMLAAVSSYVVTALENRQLVAQLRSSLAELSKSRARVLAVADEERRKIERDLHDGAQQHLVALQIKLELLAERLDEGSPDDAGRVRELEGEIEATLDEVRRFGRGVYPPLLTDRGLGDALHAVARSAAVPTTVDVRLAHRYPPEVESAVYFACLEALQNASKHASGATGVSIAVSGNGRLRFDVRDDGAGFDCDATPSSAGLTNMRDRVSALGGELEIASTPGRGTRVTGIIPLP